MFKQLLNLVNQNSVKSESGQGLVEYALILILVGTVAIAGMRFVGVNVGEVYTDINCELQADTCGTEVASINPEDDIRSDGETEPVTQPEVEPITQPEVEPVTQPEAEPVTQPEVEPATQPEVEPVTQPEVEPVTQPEVEPVMQPEVESISRPALVVVAKSVTEPSSSSVSESTTDEPPCSSTDTPAFQAQCIGGSVYMTVTSVCESVDNSSISISTGGLLDLPVDITLTKESDGLTLSSEPLIDAGLCLGANSNTLKVDATVYYIDGTSTNIGIN